MTAAASLWLGLFPLLHFGTYTRITLDKWILMFILAGITLACFLADLFMKRLSRPRLLPLCLGAGLLLWIVISCLASPYSSGIWWIGASARREGLAAQLCYLGLFFLFSFSRVSPRPVLYAAAGGVLAFGAVVLLQRAGYNPFGLYPAGRSYATNPEFLGPVGNVDMSAGCLLLLFGFLLAETGSAFRARAAGRWISFPAAAGCAALPAVLFLLAVMGVQFSLVTLAALAAVLLFRLVPKRHRLLFLALLSVAVFLAVWFWPGTGGGLWELHEILRGRPQLSFGSNRLAVWLYSLSMAGSGRLFTGGGSDTFALRFNQFLQQRELVLPDRQGDLLLPHYFDNPHNEYLAQLLNHGLPALLLFAALILSVLLVRGKKKSPPCWRAAVFCYAVQAFFSFSVCLVAPMFWVVLGLAAGLPGGGAAPDRPGSGIGQDSSTVKMIESPE